MLNYSSFLTHVEQDIRGRFDDNYTISVQNIMRNNNTTLDGLVIFRSNCNISPTIYLNPYYHRYLNGVSLRDICDDVYDTYMMHYTNNNFNTKWLEDGMAVLDHVVMRLVNLENNKAMLADMPYIPYKDLAVIFAVNVHHEEIGEGSVVIQNSHMDLWKLDVDDLYLSAIRNAPQICQPCFSTIMESIVDLCGNPGDFDDLELDEDLECPMYVLTNQSKYYGASAILYPDLLKKIAERFYSDLILIPSSIHEFIILPANKCSDLDGITQMIRDVNETELTDEEVLSDHPYYYLQSEDEIYTDAEIRDILDL